MKKIAATFVLLILSAMTTGLHAQYKSVSNIDMADGMSQNTISSIYQDERDYIWFGTRNGITLYNGKDYIVFKNDKDDPQSIPVNDIKQITGDRKGQVYFRTSKKQIMKHTLGIKGFEVAVASGVTCMYWDEGLYYACSHEIYHIPEGKDSAEPVFTFSDKKNIITSFYKQEDKLFIGTTMKGLYVLSDDGTLTQIVKDGYVSDIFGDSQHEVWVTFSDERGLLRITGKGITFYRHNPSDPHTIISDRTQACCEDLDGNIWIGTFNGLTKFDRKTETFSGYDNPEISTNSIISLMTDHQGTIWAGTYYLGVFHFNPAVQSCNVFKASQKKNGGLSSDVIGELAEDHNGNIWIATERGGLDMYDPSTKTFRNYSTKDGLPSDNVKCLLLDPDHRNLWVGTHLGGLCRFNLTDGSTRSYHHRENDGQSLPSDIIRDIIPYGKDLLIAAKGGLVVLDKNTGKCSEFFLNSDYQQLTHYCSQILIDSHDNLWMLHTSNGAFRFDIKERKFTIYRDVINSEPGMSPGRINSIYEDSRGRIWFCNSQNGLDMYDYSTDSFQNYDVRKSHLSSNAVYSISELEDNRFIVTTDNGYSVLNFEEDSFSNFQNNKNIPLVAANENSLLVASDKMIYIGGMNGMTSFRENDSTTVRRSYTINPFRIMADGVTVAAGDGTGILEKALYLSDGIEIGPDVRTFSIQYAITDFLLYDRDAVYYKMSGFSDIWHRLDDSHLITFTNLSPGKYHLLVRSIDGMGNEVCSNDLSIHVRAPFYRSIWAWFIYIGLFAAAVYIALTSYHNKIRLQEAVKYEKKHTREVEELNQYKLTFFTNISHEFRTPLTVINSQIEMLMDQHADDTSLSSPLNLIYRNCVQLKDLVSELLDFRKQEQGYISLKLVKSNMTEFVHDQFINFQTYAKQTGTTYKFIKLYEDVDVWFDRKQMKKVINNLIFNAFKHVSPNGKISVIVNRDEQNVMIDIVNTGKGIRPEEIDKIFNRFYQLDTQDNVNVGTGIGLALSKGIINLHKGNITVFSELDKETTFRISLPLGRDQFTEDDITSGKVSFVEEEPATAEVPSQELTDTGQDDRNAGADGKKEAMGIIPDTEGAEEEKVENPDSHTTILIVEDNDALRKLLMNLFEPFHQVITATDGADGLKKAQESLPDLIISDIMMPVMDGLELCRTIKSDRNTDHIPVVLLTARTEESQKIEGLKYGADDYIVKPFDNREFVARCNNIINNRMILKKRFSNSQNTGTEKAITSANNAKDLNFIKKATAIIREHLAESDFKIETLATELGVSRTKLFTRLKEIQSITPFDFMISVRLEVAAEMLQNDIELNISEISEKTGFSSPKYFRKCFKDKYGMTPLEFRKGQSG